MSFSLNKIFKMQKDMGKSFSLGAVHIAKLYNDILKHALFKLTNEGHLLRVSSIFYVIVE